MVSCRFSILSLISIHWYTYKPEKLIPYVATSQEARSVHLDGRVCSECSQRNPAALPIEGTHIEATYFGDKNHGFPWIFPWFSLGWLEPWLPFLQVAIQVWWEDVVSLKVGIWWSILLSYVWFHISSWVRSHHGLRVIGDQLMFCGYPLLITRSTFRTKIEWFLARLKEWTVYINILEGLHENYGNPPRFHQI